jgi:hypothetical protein
MEHTYSSEGYCLSPGQRILLVFMRAQAILVCSQGPNMTQYLESD